MNSTAPANIPLQAEDLLHEVFDQSTEGFQVIDQNWRYVFVNKAVARQGKKTPSELIGRTMTEAYPGIDQTPLFVQLRRAMKERVSIRMENEFQQLDGSIGWFQLFIHPWESGIMIFSVDVTDRKLAEKNLEEKIHALLASAHTDEERQKIDELKLALKKLSQAEPQVM